MMIKRISESDFRSEFAYMGRHENFSYNGLNSLYGYLNDCYTEEDPFELDVIALCVQFTEYDSLEECLQEIGNDDIKTLEDLQDHTIVIEIEGTEGIIISEF